MGIGTEPAWYGTGEVKFSKHIMLRSGSDYTLLDKLMTKRAADDAKAPNGIMAESAGAYEWTDTRVIVIDRGGMCIVIVLAKYIHEKKEKTFIKFSSPWP